MRWRQDRHTGEFIPVDEAARKRDGGAAIHGPIEAFVSPVDGSVISDRRQLREHNKRHNVVNTHEFGTEHWDIKKKERERLYNGEHTSAEKQSRGEEINRVIEHLENTGR